MREVSTYAGTGEQGIHRSIDRITRARYIVQTAADPERNLLQQSRRIDVAPVFGCGATAIWNSKVVGAVMSTSSSAPTSRFIAPMERLRRLRNPRSTVRL